jgi:RimJ/RimL family protein N-acetyltransferase
VLLRAPAPGDIEARLEVPPDPELRRMYGGSGAPQPATAETVQAQLDAITHQDRATERTFVIAALMWPDSSPLDSSCGRFVGTARLHSILWADRKATVALGIFDRRFWSHGYGTEALRLLMRLAFDDLGLHRLRLRVLHYNLRAIRCYEKCGFVREGVERESALVDGVWHDDVLMGILESEYRAQAWRGEA